MMMPTPLNAPAPPVKTARHVPVNVPPLMRKLAAGPFADDALIDITPGLHESCSVIVPKKFGCCTEIVATSSEHAYGPLLGHNVMLDGETATAPSTGGVGVGDGEEDGVAGAVVGAGDESVGTVVPPPPPPQPTTPSSNANHARRRNVSTRNSILPTPVRQENCLTQQGTAPRSAAREGRPLR